MHICPVDCHECMDPGCRAEGCRLAATLVPVVVEGVLAPCEDCGVLVVVAARHVACVECRVAAGWPLSLEEH